jgi:D-psicose/D-tagatose/L-ribulose 3-epimerase
MGSLKTQAWSPEADLSHPHCRGALQARKELREMNQIGIHAMVWVGTWGPAECRLAVENSRAAGFDLLEIPLLDPSSVDVVSTRRTLDDAGLQATCSLGLSFEADISSEDPEIVARGERLLEDALSAANGLGSRYLTGVLYGALGKYSTWPTARGRANSIAVLRRLAEHAASVDVTLGLEVVNRYESNLINTAEQALLFIDEIGASNVKVHLDTYHMNIEEADFRQPVLACGDRLGYVHVGESHRGYMGTGTVDFPQLFGALAEIGYAGPITFESFSSAVVAPELSRTLAIWRNTWSDGLDLAHHARAFVAATAAGPPDGRRSAS